MTEPEDHELEEIVGGARGEILRRADGSGARPDFADVVCRIGMLEDNAVLGPEVLEAKELSNVPGLRTAELRDRGGEEDQLDTIVAGARGAIEEHLATRRARGIPLASRRRSGSQWTVVGWAVAASVLLAVGAATVGIGGRQVASDSGVQAPMLSQSLPPSQRAVDRGREPGSLALPHAPGPEEAPEETDEAQDPAMAERAAPPTHAPVPRVGATDPDAVSDRLTALDRRARAAWRAGNLARAQRLFRELTRIGGRTRHAELAFAELFALTHRATTAERIRLWNKYLRRFPRGKFADDARAGICRARSAVSCWREYLRVLPHGSHRFEAERALATPAAPTNTGDR